jgi:hypothetical protein
MVDITKAFSILNSLLIEAQLKDSFSSMADGNMVRLVLKDGSERVFEIVENLAGRIVMVDKQSEIWYTFTKDAMVDSILTLHEYDSDKKSSKFEGKEEKLSVKEFLTGKSGGDIEVIDVHDPENVQRIDDMNSELKTTGEGDVIYISSEENKGKNVVLVNTILLKVVGVEPKRLTCTLEDIETESESGNANSGRMDKLANIFRNRNIYLDFNDLVKFKNNDLVLNLYSNNKLLPINNIIAIEVHKGDEDLESDEERELTKKELIDKIEVSPEFLQAIEKTPSFWDTLTNASPKGVNQINKILNQKSTSDSYLTKGNDVRFKLLTNSVIVNASHKLIKNNKLYTGKIQKGNIIKIGTKKQGHWELEILKELEPSIYNVKINFCNKDLSCKLYGKGAIKIVKNG